MSPELGRFLQPDPIGFKGDASNLYRYCGNDWANRSDPMGTESAEPHLIMSTKEQQVYRDWNSDHTRGAIMSALFGITRMQIRDPVKDMGFTTGGATAFHDPVKNGKNYDQSSNYRALGEKAAENAQRKLADNPRDFEERVYLGRNQNGSRDFIAEHDPTTQFHNKKTGENYSEIYNRRADPKGERDPLRGTGYRTVGVAVAEKRYVWGQIRPGDQRNFHKAGLDAWVSYPPPAGSNTIPIRFQNEGNVEP